MHSFRYVCSRSPSAARDQNGLILESEFFGVHYPIGNFVCLSQRVSRIRRLLYLLPWCILTGLTLAAPIAVAIYKERFDPFHPVIFASWSFFLPGFFIGGLTLTLGISQPYYIAYVIDEQYNLPLTFVYVILGFLGLWVASPPVGKKGGTP